MWRGILRFVRSFLRWILVLLQFGSEVNKMQRNEEYKEKYLKILKDRIERVFNYEEKDISVQMEVAEENKKYPKI